MVTFRAVLRRMRFLRVYKRFKKEFQRRSIDRQFDFSPEGNRNFKRWMRRLRWLDNIDQGFPPFTRCPWGGS